MESQPTGIDSIDRNSEDQRSPEISTSRRNKRRRLSDFVIETARKKVTESNEKRKLKRSLRKERNKIRRIRVVEKLQQRLGRKFINESAVDKPRRME